MEFIKPGRQFDFMGKRWIFIGLSLSLLVLSILAFVFKGPKLGTDFKGGTELEIAFLQPVTAAETREAVVKSGFDHPDVVKIDDPQNPHRFLIRVQEVTAVSEPEKEVIRQHLCFGR